MNKKLKIVWLVGCVAIFLLFCLQAYWLYGQYQYSLEQKVEQFKMDCGHILQADGRERKTLADKRSKKKQQHVVTIRCDVELSEKKSSNALTTISYSDNGRFLAKVKQVGISSEDAYEMCSRYLANLAKRPVVASFRVPLNAKGYEGFYDFKTSKYKKVFLEPRYEVAGIWIKTVKVDYQTNPIFHEGISFRVTIPVASALISMFWQLVGSVLLFIILACCIYYLVKTIVFQNRIDALRHEFLKNMIYEMKQPKVGENADESAIFIGSITFYYAQNELRNGNERVIVTSRQAEILKLLATHQNQLVERETILNEVWGDDSYSNSLALNVQITYLRRALSSDSSVLIEPVIKKGYILKVN